MLYPHLDRFPPLGDNQAIVPIGSSFERKREVTAEAFARFGASGPAPENVDTIGSLAAIARQFIDGAVGQIHLRYAGDRAAPPLLLIHDAPGSAEQAEPLIARLARRFFVIAPDLPGSGESDAFAAPPTTAALAAAMVGVLDALDIGRAAVYGIGFGSSVAVAVARAHPERIATVIVQGLVLPDADERAAMLAHYAPPIEIEPDGAHWYRTWLMLRDSQIYWPWYDRREAALRRVPADFSARPLHRWTMDVMRSRASYAHQIHAALDDDAGGALRGLASPLIIVADNATPLSVYNDRLRALRPDATVIDAEAGDITDALAGVVTGL